MKDNLKRLYTERFQICDILKKTKLWRQSKGSAVARSWERGMNNVKGKPFQSSNKFMKFLVICNEMYNMCLKATINLH